MELEAPILPCAGCGVALRVDPEARDARCRHCGAVTAIAEDVRERARAYRVAVVAELRRMSFSEAFARGSENGAVERVTRIYTGVVFALAAVLTAGVMAPSFGLDEAVAQIAIAVFVVGLLAAMGLFFVALRWALVKQELEGDVEPAPRAPSELATARADGRCGSCGGGVPFTLAEPTARCPYCGATVVPTEDVRARLTALATFGADLAQGRATRAHVRSVGVTGGPNPVFWILRRLVFFVPLLVGVIVGQVMMQTAPAGRRGRAAAAAAEEAELLGAGIMAGGGALTAILFGGSVLFARLGKRDPRRAALRSLAQRYGARLADPGTTAALDWLDAHWAGEAPEGSLVVHNSDEGVPVDRIAVAVHHRGAPVLLVLADAPHVRRLDVFVAGHDPRRTERAASPALAELRGAGLAVSLGRPGVHLCWPSSDARFCEPAAAAWMLDRAVAALAV